MKNVICMVVLAVSAFGQTDSLFVRNVDSKPESNSAVATIINKSKKDVVAYSLSVDSTYQNGVTIHSVMSADIGQLAVEKGKALHPGDSLQENFYSAFEKTPMAVKATVAMVVYNDGSADVYSDEGGKAFQDAMNTRKSIADGFNQSVILLRESLKASHPVLKALDSIKDSLVTAKIHNMTNQTSAGFLADTIVVLNAWPEGIDEKAYVKQILNEKQHQVDLYSNAIKVVAVWRGAK